MALSTTTTSDVRAVTDAQSDYGSDLDDGVVQDLLAEIEGVSVEPLVLEPLEDHESQQIFARIPLFSSQASTRSENAQYFSAFEEQPPQASRNTSNPKYSTIHVNGETAWATRTYKCRCGSCITDMLTARSSSEYCDSG